MAANNATWELLGPTADHDEPSLTLDQTFDLLGRAYAAAHHWRAVNGPDSINAARAAWLCSRSHAVVADGAAALRMAELCTSLTEASDDAADFDRFYAAEARSRALACLGRLEEATAVHAEARKLLDDLADAEDLKIAAGDPRSRPLVRATRPVHAALRAGPVVATRDRCRFSGLRSRGSACSPSRTPTNRGFRRETSTEVKPASWRRLVVSRSSWQPSKTQLQGRRQDPLDQPPRTRRRSDNVLERIESALRG